MKSNYEERKENRVAAYTRLSSKNEQVSEQSFEHAHKLSDRIPFGEPIKIGHHSEKRHRKHFKDIDNAMRKGVEASKKSAYYADRVESILSNKAISSDDPNAIDKLKEKLERLETLQVIMKDANKIVKRNKGTQAEKVEELKAIGFSEIRANALFTPDFCGRIGFADYALTNNNATIRTVRKRVEQLTKIAAIQTSEEVINGVRLVINAEDNRVQLFFPDIPTEATRKLLKQNGFHWAPSIQAWMRQISNWAIYSAKDILKGLAQ